MLEFEQFIKDGKVYKRESDMQLAKTLMEDAQERLKSAKEDLKRKPKYSFEDAYEAVVELLDAMLAVEGYKSYSHEANIAFLSKINFSTVEIENLDRLRKKRNSCKYYGRKMGLEEAIADVRFLEVVFDKILIILKKKFK